MKNIFTDPYKDEKEELKRELEKQKQKQKELENAPKEELKDPLERYKNIKTQDTLIKIDKYLFKVSQNIETIATSLSIGIKKIETIKTPIYQKIGGNEETISIQASILAQNIQDYEGFKALCKKAKPLSLQILNAPSQKILIQRLGESKRQWVQTKERGVTYFIKELSIEGVVI
ncbi:hypothetical protein BKH46_08800 [Helicobacter sp. 12S02634-8]|uniref:hypothetical protein n=1 Tax=Helicobacter sp. 12S02634-8 TaxID=1476199 RepID=UPI000BA62357|nr:hypothetical protein [Helicobacter sp. 12S02634-8]PAF46135.1 hypothetical protein BKH46_08800 [Helicobacter sp. 12S02634-8]